MAFQVADTVEMKAVFGVSDIQVGKLKQGEPQTLAAEAIPGVQLTRQDHPDRAKRRSDYADFRRRSHGPQPGWQDTHGQCGFAEHRRCGRAGYR